MASSDGGSQEVVLVHKAHGRVAEVAAGEKRKKKVNREGGQKRKEKENKEKGKKKKIKRKMGKI